MSYLKYKTCRYIYSLDDPGKFIDFGIIAATKEEIALFGINLVDLGLIVEHPFQHYLFTQTVDTLWKRIVREKEIKEGLDLVDRFNTGPTNLTFSEAITTRKYSTEHYLSAATLLILKDSKIWDGTVSVHGYKANLVV